ncbi:MAG: MAPEG family protein [Rhodobacterales bacterium]|nr:MAPEG family protein [Rhodobacterales bacterium]
MTSTQAVALYAGLNIALLVLLAIRVVGRRRSAQVSVGDGGDEDLALRIRTHGNAAEYVPAFLVGLFLSAALGCPVWGVHALGGSFTLGRLLHAYGLSATKMAPRALGMLLTWIPMLGVAGLLIWQGAF